MKVRLLSVFAIVLVFSSLSFSQFRMSIGPTVGLNFNLHTGSDLPESGNGFGMVGGAQVDMEFSRTIGILANIQFYDNRYGSYSVTNSGTIQYNNVDYQATETDDINASLAYFSLEPLLKISLPSNGFFFYVGPSVGFNIEGTAEVKRNLAIPGLNFNKSSSDKSPINNTLVRFELKAGAGLDIPVGSSMAITPQLGFGYGLTKVISNVSWRILTIQGMVTYKFKLI